MIIGVTDDRANEEISSTMRGPRPSRHGDCPLTPQDGNGSDLRRCRRLVLTGGGDLDFGRTGKPRGTLPYDVAT